MKKSDLIFGIGTSGYELLSKPRELPSADQLTFLEFCRSIAWRPAKLDHPEIACKALLPIGQMLCICSITQESDDRYGRGPTLRIEGWLVKNQYEGTIPFLNSLFTEHSKLIREISFPIKRPTVLDPIGLLKHEYSKPQRTDYSPQKFKQTTLPNSMSGSSEPRQTADKRRLRFITFIAGICSVCLLLYAYTSYEKNNELQASLNAKSKELHAQNKKITKIESDLNKWTRFAAKDLNIKDPNPSIAAKSVSSLRAQIETLEKTISKAKRDLSGENRQKIVEYEKLLQQENEVRKELDKLKELLE